MYESSGLLSRRAFASLQLVERKIISSFQRIWYSFLITVMLTGTLNHGQVKQGILEIRLQGSTLAAVNHLSS